MCITSIHTFVHPDGRRDQIQEYVPCADPQHRGFSADPHNTSSSHCPIPSPYPVPRRSRGRPTPTGSHNSRTDPRSSFRSFLSDRVYPSSREIADRSRCESRPDRRYQEHSVSANDRRRSSVQSRPVSYAPSASRLKDSRPETSGDVSNQKPRAPDDRAFQSERRVHFKIAHGNYSEPKGYRVEHGSGQRGVRSRRRHDERDQQWFNDGVVVMDMETAGLCRSNGSQYGS
ncbi:hypothetical protein FSARC_13749 [Fusarium sarcochroum]|uniref:Uncharacterized protein n=1 Tax=Fusarium sarcochroum TaxID=1208366 RepID=A0A8H4SZK7_9HYPO|nr:hypothetical protein FSARC_13749 [Fusarium sarcochroum]